MRGGRAVMSKLMFFDDLKVGDRWVTPSKQITRQDAAQFAAVTLDFNPLHLDDEFAGESPFGRPIAHGLLGLSLVAGLVSDCPRLETIALLGVYDWQFVRPIYYGDRVHVISEIVELEPAGRKRGRVMWSRSLINQTGYTVQHGRFDTLVTRCLAEVRGRMDKRELQSTSAVTAPRAEDSP
jgi:3-hydroxybutyryl-CoA dehydratase